jgi:hypothetical protein
LCKVLFLLFPAIFEEKKAKYGVALLEEKVRRLELLNRG